MYDLKNKAVFKVVIMTIHIIAFDFSGVIIRDKSTEFSNDIGACKLTRSLTFITHPSFGHTNKNTGLQKVAGKLMEQTVEQ